MFSLGLEGQPDLVKPNRAELEAWAGRPLDNDDALLEAAGLLQVTGAKIVAVSLGSEGAWLVTGEAAWFAPGLKVEAKSTVGAGDAFVAALTRALVAGLPGGECLAQAVATATASVIRPGTGAGDPQDIEKFLSCVTVQRRDVSRRKS